MRSSHDRCQSEKKIQSVMAVIAAASGLALLAVTAPATATEAEAIRPFKVSIAEKDLVELKRRIEATRWPTRELLGHSITFRIVVGPRAGQKLFTLQTVPPRLQGLEGELNGAARAGGFSLHAGVDIAPNQREKLERLCRYVSRPPVATERLALTTSGHVRYTLKTPYRDGTTHIVLEPLDLLARLAALVPPPRMHLTRYLGVFAPHSNCARRLHLHGGAWEHRSSYPRRQLIQPSRQPRDT